MALNGDNIINPVVQCLVTILVPNPVVSTTLVLLASLACIMHYMKWGVIGMSLHVLSNSSVLQGFGVQGVGPDLYILFHPSLLLLLLLQSKPVGEAHASRKGKSETPENQLLRAFARVTSSKYRVSNG